MFPKYWDAGQSKFKSSAPNSLNINKLITARLSFYEEALLLAKGKNRVIDSEIFNEKLVAFAPTNGIHIPVSLHRESFDLIYRIALEARWNPLDESANTRLRKEIIGVDLHESLVLFESYHTAKGTRPKSISNYLSTIKTVIKYQGRSKKVYTISDYDTTDFLNYKERWTGLTYNNCRIALNNIFR